MKLVAVTACPMGVAHTYIAKKALETAAAAKGIGIKVETQGAMGTENTLTQEDILQADAALLATEIEIAGASRFENIKTVRVPIQTAVKSADALLDKLVQALEQTP